MLTTTQMLVLAGVVLLFAIVIIAWAKSRTNRHRQVELKRRFGPEYDREVEQHGNVARAERELAAREKRVQRQHVKPLAENDRVKFSNDWRNVQARFVDDPSGAVQSADELIKEVMNARGYSNEGFERRVADLTVEHAGVVQHYRAAHELADANREGRANTEELRQAVQHYRALFSDLLEQPQLPEAQRLQEARA